MPDSPAPCSAEGIAARGSEVRAVAIMAKSVYIETTIPGAYFEEREDVVSRFQRYATRRWWDELRQEHQLYTSEAVIAELQQPRFPFSTQAVELLVGVNRLPLTEEIRGVVKIYLVHQLMPKGDAGDAFHLAFASVHELDYMLTWNCRHLANPRKVTYITAINRRIGLLTPTILTPQILAGGEIQ